jgi:hypothetical protein
MHLLFILLFCMYWSNLVYAESDELISFSNGSIADADDVNHNFDLLEKRLKILESREHGIELDCTDNPAALRDAYQLHFDKSELTFSIKGKCYGSFANTGAPDYNELQVSSQEVTIFGNEEGATLIPDERGVIGLVASFGGGLHVSDLDIEVPAEYSNWVLLYSRNAYGTVQNVNITGGNTYNGIIRSQRSSNVYVINTIIQTSGNAIVAANAGSVVFFQGNSITSSRGDSLNLQSGTTMKALTDLETSGQITLNPGSSFANKGVLKFNRFHSDGASVDVQGAFFTGSLENQNDGDPVRLNNSQGRFYFSKDEGNLLNLLNIVIHGSKINLSNEGSSNDEPSIIKQLRLERGSSLWLRGHIRFTEIRAVNSTIRFEYLDQNHTDKAYYLTNSQARVLGPFVPLEQMKHLSIFTCSGISVLDYYGQSLTDIDTNCRGNSDW